MCGSIFVYTISHCLLLFLLVLFFVIFSLYLSSTVLGENRVGLGGLVMVYVNATLVYKNVYYISDVFVKIKNCKVNDKKMKTMFSPWLHSQRVSSCWIIIRCTRPCGKTRAADPSVFLPFILYKSNSLNWQIMK